MVIDMPTTNVEAYVNQFLTWLPMRSDEQLVDTLNSYIMSTRKQVMMEDLPLRQMNLLETPFFKGVDGSTRNAIVMKLTE